MLHEHLVKAIEGRSFIIFMEIGHTSCEHRLIKRSFHYLFPDPIHARPFLRIFLQQLVDKHYQGGGVADIFGDGLGLLKHYVVNYLI